jgi:hypothetical protein
MIRPATQSDLEAFYEGVIPVTMRAFVVEVDGVVAGVGGVYDENGVSIAFSQMKEPLRAHKRLVVSCAMFLRDVIRETKETVFALANQKEKNAPRLLERLGFEYVGPTNVGPLYVFRRE